jgi:ethanolamine utilization protein EutN
MELAVVIGQVVSTVKCPGIHKERLLVVDFVDAKGKPRGEPHVAADSIGAGDGEWVLVTQGSSARRASPDAQSLPIDMSIVGIVDEVVIKGHVAYHK